MKSFGTSSVKVAPCCKHWFVLVIEGIVNTVGGLGV